MFDLGSLLIQSLPVAFERLLEFALPPRREVAVIQEPENVAREQARGERLGELFGDQARRISTCPSKADGGDLNWFPRAGSMVEPFAAAAFALRNRIFT